MAPQNVVAAAEVGRAIHHAHRRGLLHHTDHTRIAPRILADGTGLFLSEVATLTAGPDPLGHGSERRGEPPGLFRWLLKKMEGEPLRGLPPDSGKPGKLGDQLSIALTGQKGEPNGSEGTLRISLWSISAARR